MRIVTYNVSGGPDPAAAGAVLAGIGADVVCLVEIPGGARLRTLARRAGLDVAERAGRRAGGTALLVDTDVRVRATSRVPLSTPDGATTREASHAIVGLGGLGLSVTAVQFGLRPEVRRANLDELLTFVRSIDLPTVVGCDCNESVRAPVAQTLASLYQDAHAVAGTGAGLTYPTVDPSTRQDFVFVDPDIEVITSWTVVDEATSAASHHLPVVADLRPRLDTTVVDAAGVGPEVDPASGGR